MYLRNSVLEKRGWQINKCVYSTFSAKKIIKKASTVGWQVFPNFPCFFFHFYVVSKSSFHLSPVPDGKNWLKTTEVFTQSTRSPMHGPPEWTQILEYLFFLWKKTIVLRPSIKVFGIFILNTDWSFMKLIRQKMIACSLHKIR